MESLHRKLNSCTNFQKMEAVVQSIQYATIYHRGRKFSQSPPRHALSSKDYVCINDLLRKWKMLQTQLVKPKEGNKRNPLLSVNVDKKIDAFLNVEAGYRILHSLRILNGKGNEARRRASLGKRIAIAIKSFLSRFLFYRGSLLRTNLEDRIPVLRKKFQKKINKLSEWAKKTTGDPEKKTLSQTCQELQEKWQTLENSTDLPVRTKHTHMTELVAHAIKATSISIKPQQLLGILFSSDPMDMPKKKEQALFLHPLKKEELQREVIGMEDIKEKFTKPFEASKIPQDKRKELDIHSIPSGCLLYGPPGCGKSFFAAHMSLQTDRPTYVATASQLICKYVGESQKRLHQMFAEAKRQAPCNLIIDEFDSLAPKRNALEEGKNTSMHYTEFVNELLRQLEEAREKGVFVIGTTNYIDRVDEAVLRDGRIDYKIEISLPDKKLRQRILQEQFGKIDAKYADISSCNFERLADSTKDWNISDLVSLANKIKIDIGVEKESMPSPKITQALIEQKIEEYKDSKKALASTSLSSDAANMYV